MGAAVVGVLVAGCDGGVSDSDAPELDAGPDVLQVNLDGGGAPAVPPDGVAACPQGTCNYQSGEGCPVEAAACIPGTDAMNGITPVCQPAGAGTSGAACTDTSTCAPGYFCAEKSCRKLCCAGDWTGCPSEDEHCIKSLAYGDGMGGALTTGAMLCYPVNTCNALVPSSCGEPGTTCQIADPTGATACLCLLYTSDAADEL